MGSEPTESKTTHIDPCPALHDSVLSTERQSTNNSPPVHSAHTRPALAAIKTAACIRLPDM